ncbi:GntR family transcriptional regulator, partial [Pseudorhodoplanes sp.]|uniref:GntR family transcriptional regulator n=1 Tax=Pseudorhodoplanes sp. TaxID=1934341 RepID=UPI003D0EB005
PIREALQLVERDGLIAREQRKGVRVAILTTEDLDELYACRISLEVTAARLSAKNATDIEIKRLCESQAQCEERYRKNDVVGHFRANVEMSQRIFEAAHNRQLVRLLASIHKQALRYRYIAYQNSGAARKNSINNNAKLVDAIRRRDSEKAASLMRSSIESSHGLIRDCLIDRDEKRRTAMLRPKKR